MPAARPMVLLTGARARARITAQAIFEPFYWRLDSATQKQILPSPQTKLVECMIDPRVGRVPVVGADATRLLRRTASGGRHIDSRLVNPKDGAQAGSVIESRYSEAAGARRQRAPIDLGNRRAVSLRDDVRVRTPTWAGHKRDAEAASPGLQCAEHCPEREPFPESVRKDGTSQ